MMGLLLKLRDLRREELAHEAELVKLLAHELKCKEDVVWQGIQWWKLKNRWKRPVSQDDAKAYRMVKGWIRRNKS